MDIRSLLANLKSARDMLRAVGATKPASDVAAVEALITKSDDATVEQFVERSKSALAGPKPGAESADEFVARLSAAGENEAVLGDVLKRLSDRSIDKQTVAKVAAAYTGASEKSFKSKPIALAAIRTAFNDRAYLVAKRRVNEKVTPW